MKVAVTACSGGLGAAIVKHAVREFGKKNVIGICRTPSKAEHLEIEIRKGDYNSKYEFESALKGIDVVMIISAHGPPEPRVAMHKNVIEAGVKCGVKKIVYSSIIGNPETSEFSGIVRSNRKTEEIIKNSGLEYAIGRNGIYIEPDVEYIEQYKKDGKIINCAGDEKCFYTTRDELAYAYVQMMKDEKHNGQAYNLGGEAISQYELAGYLNKTFNTNVVYKSVSIDDYKKERVAELGEFLGTVISGIYASIRNGDFDVNSDYETAAARKHISWEDYFSNFAK